MHREDLIFLIKCKYELEMNLKIMRLDRNIYFNNVNFTDTIIKTTIK